MTVFVIIVLKPGEKLPAADCSQPINLVLVTEVYFVLNKELHLHLSMQLLVLSIEGRSLIVITAGVERSGNVWVWGQKITADVKHACVKPA